MSLEDFNKVQVGDDLNYWSEVRGKKLEVRVEEKHSNWALVSYPNPDNPHAYSQFDFKQMNVIFANLEFK